MRKIKLNPERNSGFHKDANGSAMVFVVLVLFTLVCFFVFTIHIGQRFTHKVEMQNAADAAAISGAVWKARGLNLISLLNVSMSECLALIIMFKAFDSALDATKVTIEININAARACSSFPPTAAACRIWLACLKVHRKALYKAYTKINKAMKKTYKSPKLLWKLMSALKTVSESVSVVSSVMSYIDASRIADRNGADAFGQVEIGGNNIGLYAVLWPYQIKLPVEEGSFEEDLCDHAWNGGEGYRNYLCYDDAFDVEVAGLEIDATLEVMWGSLVCILPNPIVYYELMKKNHYKDLCSNGSSGPSGDENNNSQATTIECQKCSDESGEAKWKKYRVEVTDNECNDENIADGAGVVELEQITLSNGHRPQGTLVDNGRDIDLGNPEIDPDDPPRSCKVCAGVDIEAPAQEGDPPRYFAEMWMLTSCTYESEEEQEIEVETDSDDFGNNDGDKVKPLVLTDDWEKKMKYTSLVFKYDNSVENSDFLGADQQPILSLNSDMSGELITYGEDGDSRLKDGPVEIPEKTWAVARAEVYNPGGHKDLFNQNWHAKLAPVDIEGIQTEFLGIEVELPDALTNVANDVVEEVWAH
ncbi:MAG: pilus assembly protein TadG-related protein [Desulfobacteraceae bacterium]|jgi:hypothetical protein